MAKSKRTTLSTNELKECPPSTSRVRNRTGRHRSARLVSNGSVQAPWRLKYRRGGRLQGKVVDLPPAYRASEAVEFAPSILRADCLVIVIAVACLNALRSRLVELHLVGIYNLFVTCTATRSAPSVTVFSRESMFERSWTQKRTASDI